jgi:hypothetical protein
VRDSLRARGFSALFIGEPLRPVQHRKLPRKALCGALTVILTCGGGIGWPAGQSWIKKANGSFLRFDFVFFNRTWLSPDASRHCFRLSAPNTEMRQQKRKRDVTLNLVSEHPSALITTYD